MSLLEDKVAVITGSGGGLGEGIAVCMANEGAHVVVCDSNKGQVEKTALRIEKTGQHALVVQADISRKKDCEELIRSSLEAMGTIDILVCAAGVGGFSHRKDSDEPLILENISEEDWDLTFDVNLKGVFLCNQAIAPHFRKQKSGSIINIGSIAGRKGIDWIPHYSASKAGLIVFTQSVALQFAPLGVNVNTICPGFVRTPMWDIGAKVLGQACPAFRGMNPNEIFQSVVQSNVPTGRPQTEEDIGQLAVFLASRNAKEITGQAINVDGGACLN